ncbi:MAG: GFA family protein [Pseudomonadales bacterium]|nr:GFA family protein [Pseudomonadales bacterium]
MSHAGSCLCGRVAFQVHGDFQKFFLCHCVHCRKDTGSSNAANLFSTTAEIDWLRGQDLVSTFKLPDTLHRRSFCSNCGSALPYWLKEINLVVVPAGSLDSAVPIRPQGHLFMASKANWDSELDKVTCFERLPA